MAGRTVEADISAARCAYAASATVHDDKAAAFAAKRAYLASAALIRWARQQNMGVRVRGWCPP